VELLPDCVAFLGDGCELLGYPTQLMGNGDELLDELRQEGDGGRFGGDGVGQYLGAEVGKVSGVKAKGAAGLGQLFCHKG